MQAAPTRLELRIDIFEATDQLALVSPNLTPFELIKSILQEFQELEYLGDLPVNYQLLRASDRLPLDSGQPLAQQCQSEKHLILVEKEVALPFGTQRPSQNIYLREIAPNNASRVYKLRWLPALIGRLDKNQPHNDWLSIKLDSHHTGLRVSRRHAQITEMNGNFYIENLSNNPTLIKSLDGKIRLVTPEKQLLQHSELIVLERSNIHLKFIVHTSFIV